MTELRDVRSEQMSFGDSPRESSRRVTSHDSLSLKISELRGSWLTSQKFKERIQWVFL